MSTWSVYTRHPYETRKPWVSHTSWYLCVGLHVDASPGLCAQSFQSMLPCSCKDCKVNCHTLKITYEIEGQVTILSSCPIDSIEIPSRHCPIVLYPTLHLLSQKSVSVSGPSLKCLRQSHLMNHAYRPHWIAQGLVRWTWAYKSLESVSLKFATFIICLGLSMRMTVSTCLRNLLKLSIDLDTLHTMTFRKSGFECACNCSKEGLLCSHWENRVFGRPCSLNWPSKFNRFDWLPL